MVKGGGNELGRGPAPDINFGPGPILPDVNFGPGPILPASDFKGSDNAIPF